MSYGFSLTVAASPHTVLLLLPALSLPLQPFTPPPTTTIFSFVLGHIVLPDTFDP